MKMLHLRCLPFPFQFCILPVAFCLQPELDTGAVDVESADLVLVFDPLPLRLALEALICN